MNTKENIRERNKEVFWDTIRLINSRPWLIRTVSETIENTEVWSDGEEIVLKERKPYDRDCEIVVSQKRTFMAAFDSYKDYMLSAVLNFANAYVPGGGVLSGSGAQEESLCRCSTLYPSLNSDKTWEKYYKINNVKESPLGSEGIIFSPFVKVIKSDVSAPERIEEGKWMDISVITCAAPDLRHTTVSDDEYEKAMRKRIRRILTVAVNKDIDNLILGAFGCGAFKNPPEVVARLFKEELEPFRRYFRRIEFAILGYRDDDPNYETFRKEF